MRLHNLAPVWHLLGTPFGSGSFGPASVAMMMFCDRFSECLCPVPAGGYASTAVLVRFVACLLPIRCLFVAYSLPVCPLHAPIANPYSPIQCASIHRTSGPIYDQLSGIAIHRQRQRPAQHEPAEPVHHCNQVQESLCHPDIGDIRAPVLRKNRTTTEITYDCHQVD